MAFIFFLFFVQLLLAHAHHAHVEASHVLEAVVLLLHAAHLTNGRGIVIADQVAALVVKC